MAADEFLDRCSALKHEVVDFALQPRFSGALRRFLRDTPAIDEEPENVVDRFIQQHRWPDGRTVVDRFLAERPDIEGAERAHLLGWHDVVEGIFEIHEHDGTGVHTTNVVDALDYRVRSNMGSELFETIPDGSFLDARVVPLDDDWVLSASMMVYRPDERDRALDAAAERVAEHPELVYRNPTLCDRAFELAATAHQQFLDHFGTDLIVLDAGTAQPRLAAYLRTRFEEPATADALATEFLGELRGGIETVGLVSDEAQGFEVLGDLGLVVAAFDDPELAKEHRYRRLLKGYLDDDSVSALSLLRLAERDHAKATAVFRAITGRPGFGWDADGEELLRARKPGSFTTRYPGATVLGETLAAHLRYDHVGPGPAAIRA